MTINEFKQFCKEKGIGEAAKLMRDWVDKGQPDDFCPNHTVRALCRDVSNEMTGENADSCANSKYGAEIYAYAWRLTDELPEK